VVVLKLRTSNPECIHFVRHPYLKESYPNSNHFRVRLNLKWCRGKVDVRLPGKENSISHGAKPVY
jgi:hypothetical protein